MKQERTKQKIQSLSRYIIEKAECDSYRAGTRSKQWHIEADQKLLDAVGGRSVLLRQAGELEKLTGISGKTNDENTNTEATVEKKEEKQISEKVIKSPMNGTVIPLSEVPDAVFSSEMLGKGFGVEPSEGKAYAPVDGEVTTVFDTKHALGLMSKNGVELLIHIGMDTVKLNGRGFDVKVKAGDQVKAGDLLAEFDMDLIKSEGYPVTTAVVITNTDDCEAIGEVKTGAVTKDTDVLTVL